MYDAIWNAKGVDHLVVVTSYLGKGPDGRDYVAVEGSSTGLPVDELRFINEDDPYNSFTSIYIDPQGRINFCE